MNKKTPLVMEILEKCGPDLYKKLAMDELHRYPLHALTELLMNIERELKERQMTKFLSEQQGSAESLSDFQEGR